MPIQPHHSPTHREQSRAKKVVFFNACRWVCATLNGERTRVMVQWDGHEEIEVQHPIGLKNFCLLNFPASDHHSCRFTIEHERQREKENTHQQFVELFVGYVSMERGRRRGMNKHTTRQPVRFFSTSLLPILRPFAPLSAQAQVRSTRLHLHQKKESYLALCMNQNI